MDFAVFEEKHNKIMDEFKSITSGWDKATTEETMNRIYSEVGHLMFQIETLVEDNVGLEYDLFIARKERDAALYG
jgi:hypothetical protein